MKILSLVSLLVFATVLAAAQAPEGKQEYVGGFVESSIYPLFNESGQIIQWNANTFSGWLIAGTRDHWTPCNRYCYGSNGKGEWHFNLTGSKFCLKTCTYVASGELVVSEPIRLPDGSTTLQASAVLNGTFTGPDGDVHKDAVGYYNTFTSPAKNGVTVPAAGGLVIVLGDN